MANRGPNLIEGQEPAQSAPRERTQPLVDNLSNEAVRPHYRYIETQVMNAGVGRLGAALNYAHTLNRALGELERGVNERVNDKANESVRNIRSYERMEQMSTHLAASEALTSYQINLQNLQQQHLEKNPSGEGLYDLTLNSINDMGRNILSTFGTPELRATMQTNLNQMAVHQLSFALKTETQMREAFEAQRFDELIKYSSSEIAMGTDPGNVITSLQPAIEALPNGIRNKYAQEAKNQLLMQSLEMQCKMGNPDLARANLAKNDSIYKALKPTQRSYIENLIGAAEKDSLQKFREYKGQIIKAATASPNSSERKLFEKVNSEDIDYFEAERLKGEGKISDGVYKALVKEIDKRHLDNTKDSAHMLACREIGRKRGDFKGIKKEIQERIFVEDLTTLKGKYSDGQPIYGEKIALDSNGQPILDKDGNPKIQRAPRRLLETR